MELARKTNTVMSGNGIGENSDFSIAVNAKMFRVLSDTMYQDKVGSMVRELSCNAMDAHTEAGTPNTPFEIHLPDQIEPWFAVKDNGIGMDDETLRAMYTTYGESTKDQSNDVVGAFGLGSKTPFAYTDQFTVTSIHGGMERIYVAVMNDEGLPVLMLQTEKETSQHAGLEINVSVRDGDYQEFREAVLSQLRFFKVKPELTNNRHGIEFADLNDAEHIQIEKNGIRVYGGGHYSPVRGIWVVQGGVGYRLNRDNLGDHDDVTKRFAKAIEDKGAILEFPIGEIEVTASREGISYTETVQQRIIDRVRTMAALISKEAIDEIRKLPTVWEKAVHYNGQLDVIRKAVQNVPDFEKLFEGMYVDMSHYGNHNMTVEVDALKDLGFTAIRMVKSTGHTRNYSQVTRLQRRTIVSANNKGHVTNGVQLIPVLGVNVYLRDTNSKPIARIKHFAEENDYPEILMIEGLNTKEKVTTGLKRKIANALGIPVSYINLLSDLDAPKVVRNGVSVAADRRPRGFMYEENKYHHQSNNWEPIFDNLQDIGEAIYIEMDRHYVRQNDDVRILLAAADAGYLKTPIIAVNGQTFRRIEDGKIEGDLISAADAAKPLYELRDKAASTFQSIAKYAGYRASMGRQSVLMQVEVGGGNLIATRISQLEERLKGLSFLQKHGIDTTNSRTDGEKAGDARKEQLFAKYPMLKHLNGYGESTEDARDYVKLIDSQA